MDDWGTEAELVVVRHDGIAQQGEVDRIRFMMWNCYYEVDLEGMATALLFSKELKSEVLLMRILVYGADI